MFHALLSVLILSIWDLRVLARFKALHHSVPAVPYFDGQFISLMTSKDGPELLSSAIPIQYYL
jgi:hypothetical protein